MSDIVGLFVFPNDYLGGQWMVMDENVQKAKSIL